MRQDCTLSALLFNVLLEFLGGAITQEQEIRDSNRKWRNQTFPIWIWHDPIPKRHQKLYQKITRNHKYFYQVAGYRMNISKSVAFLYTNSAHTQKEIRESIPFTITSKQ
jgi:hypothetical protein